MEGHDANGATPDHTVSDTVAKNDAQQLQERVVPLIKLFKLCQVGLNVKTYKLIT